MGGWRRDAATALVYFRNRIGESIEDRYDRSS